MYGAALINPTIHEFFSHNAGSVQWGAESGMPNSIGKLRFAPFDPVINGRS
jgi:hypothetical protein